MKIKLICVGKTGKDFLVAGEQEYLGRLKHYVQAERIEVPDIRNQKKLSREQVREREGQEILGKIGPGESFFLLDEGGKRYSSVTFSKFLQQQFNRGGQGICFIIGGAYGFSEELYHKSAGSVSLSDMTFSHQMVRMIFLEQVYRAMTILRGEPYHHQ